MMFGEHAAFIVPSYIISALSLIGMTLWINLTWRARKAELAKLERATSDNKPGHAG